MTFGDISAVVTKNNKSSKIFFLILIITGVITTFGIMLIEIDNEYNNIFLLPSAYSMLLFVFLKAFLNTGYKFGPLFYSGQIFIYIRYVVTPFSIAISPQEFRSAYGPNPLTGEMNTAIVLMIYEMIMVFIVIYIAIYKYSQRKTVIYSKNYSFLNNKFIITTIVLLFLAILINFPNSIIPSQVLFIDEDFSKAVYDTQVDGVIGIISILFKCLAFLLLLSILKKYEKKFPSFIISFIIFIVFIASFTGTSRWTMIFMATSGIIVIIRLYPKYKRTVIIGTISILIPSIISVSMYKFWWVIQDSASPIKDVLLDMSTQFQSYFSGPRIVAQSLNVRDYFPNISIETLLNDFLGSIPFVSNFIDQQDRINMYFNTYNYRGTMPTLVMPLVGIGYTYFGFILAPLFTIICHWLIIKLDSLLQSELRLEFVFIYMYLGLRLSMSMGLNTQSLFASFIVPTLPLLLILILNRKVTLKNNKKYTRIL